MLQEQTGDCADISLTTSESHVIKVLRIPATRSNQASTTCVGVANDCSTKLTSAAKVTSATTQRTHQRQLLHSYCLLWRSAKITGQQAIQAVSSTNQSSPGLTGLIHRVSPSNLPGAPVNFIPVNSSSTNI